MELGLSTSKDLKFKDDHKEKFVKDITSCRSLASLRLELPANWEVDWSELVGGIARMSRLHRFRLQTPSKEDAVLPPELSGRLVRLRRVVIEGTPFAALLPAVRPNSLKYLKVEVTIPAGGSAIFDTIGRFTNVTELHLNLEGGNLQWGTVIGPCLPLSKLETVEVRTSTTLGGQNDDELARMAESWPELVSLTVSSDDAARDLRSRKLPTIQGLQCFARHCPYLHELAINVEAHFPDHEHVGRSKQAKAKLLKALYNPSVQPLTSLWNLNLLKSDVSDWQESIEIGCLLDALFPNAAIKYEAERDYDYGWDMVWLSIFYVIRKRRWGRKNGMDMVKMVYGSVPIHDREAMEEGIGGFEKTPTDWSLSDEEESAEDEEDSEEDEDD